MEINEIVAQVVQKVPEESRTAVEGMLKQVERSYAAMAEDVRIANSESKERRLKLRDAEQKLSEFETEVEKLKNDTTVSELTKQVESLKGFQSQVFKQNRDAFRAKIETYTKHPAFEKVAPILGIPKKDDKLDIDGMDDSAIQAGFSKLTEYEQLGVFDGQKQTRNTPVPKIEGGGEPNPIELAKSNPEAYAEYRKQKGLKPIR